MTSWKKWALISVVVFTIAATLYMYNLSRRPKGVEVKTSVVTRGDISSSLSVSGTIQSRDRKDYFVAAPTKVEKVYVSIGDRVKKDELLIRLETLDLSSQLKQAYIQLDMASITLENLKKQRDEIKKLKDFEIPTASMTPQMSQVSNVDIDNQIKLQQKQVELARNNVNSIKEKMRDAQSEIKSDIEGIVTGLNTAEGGTTNPAMPVITVENPENIKVVLNVSQYDAVRVKEGQEAAIRLEEDGKVYKGKVEKVNPTAKKTQSVTGAETAIPVDVSIENADGDIRIGFDVDVDIKTESKKGVLSIPYEAVITDKDGNNRVFVMENNTAILKDIQIGLESDFQVEVISGLKEGENVIVNPPSKLKNGSMVRLRSGEGK